MFAAEPHFIFDEVGGHAVDPGIERGEVRFVVKYASGPVQPIAKPCNVDAGCGQRVFEHRDIVDVEFALPERRVSDVDELVEASLFLG